MEEILASIRRILNEEEQPAPLEQPPEAPPEDDVLVLDQSMLVSPAQLNAAKKNPYDSSYHRGRYV